MSEYIAPQNDKKSRSAPEIRGRRGRSLDPEKHQRILNAATQAFLEKGYRSASMDVVARRAGVSKITVYSHFKSKEALFGSIISSLAQQLLTTINRPALGEMSAEQALHHVGRTYLQLALMPSSLALHRVVVGESARIAGLGPLIYQSGPARVMAALADYFMHQRSLRIADPNLAAEQFLGMVLGQTQLRLLLNVAPKDDAEREIDRCVDHAVQIFLNGVLTAGGAALNGARG